MYKHGWRNTEQMLMDTHTYTQTHTPHTHATPRGISFLKVDQSFPPEDAEVGAGVGKPLRHRGERAAVFLPTLVPVNSFS